ncbi:MAG: glycosyltransferase [Acetobacter sp.]|jgi:glycosyltransferase involved in cell wall biosynthesis
MTQFVSSQIADTVSDVAIIMRTKNRLLLLPRALSSVLLQKFPQWHLYLVNDGGDKEALEQLLSVYLPVFGNRLTVIHHETSKGMEAASNAALSVGNEQFVIVHDDDDSWDSSFLLQTVRFLNAPKNTGYLGVATSCYVIGEIIEDDGSIRETDRHVWAREDAAADYTRMLFSNTFPPICFLFRRSIVQKIGPFNADLPVLGDWDFNIRLMSRGDIGHIKAPLANYYHRRTNTASIYSNSVVGGMASHKLQNILLRNKMLRQLLDKKPEMLGLLMAILPPIQETNEKVGHTEKTLSDLRSHILYLEGILKHSEERMNQVIEMNKQIQMVASWNQKILRPIHKIWKTALPFRRIVARLRGRS